MELEGKAGAQPPGGGRGPGAGDKDLVGRKGLYFSFPFLRFLLVLSCLGQAADLVVSITRSSAVGIMLTPPKLERVPTWGSA